VAGLIGGMKPLHAALLGQAAAGLAVSAAESVSRKMSMKNLTHSMSALKRRVKEL
jgi:hypothetical protein